jgi:hypothetical protein
MHDNDLAHVDFLDRKLQIGDWIIISRAWNNVPFIEIGRVIKLCKGSRIRVYVARNHYHLGGYSICNVSKSEKVIVVNPLTLPKRFWDVLSDEKVSKHFTPMTQVET